MLAVGIQRAVRDGNFAEHGWLLLASSALAIERREYAHALVDIQSAERIADGLPQEEGRAHLRLAALLSGTAQIGAGRIDVARQYLDAQRKVGEPEGDVEKWSYKAFEGEVALARGELQNAASAFSAGEPPVRMWFEMIRGTSSLLARPGVA